MPADTLTDLTTTTASDIGKTPRLRSTIIQSSHNPVWNQRAILYVADEADDITVEIKVCAYV